MTARRLMIVAKDERLSNTTHVSHLPPSWGTLYELTKLASGTSSRLIKQSSPISPTTRRKTASFAIFRLI